MPNQVKGVRMSKYILEQFDEVKKAEKRRTGRDIVFSDYVRHSLVKEMGRYLREQSPMSMPIRRHLSNTFVE
jgi:hypothetical protein